MNKDSKPKQFSIIQEEYDTRWDAIFNRPTQKELEDAAAETEAFAAVKEKEIKDFITVGSLMKKE